jgi:hypothetical protein
VLAGETVNGVAPKAVPPVGFAKTLYVFPGPPPLAVIVVELPAQIGLGVAVTVVGAGGGEQTV